MDKRMDYEEPQLFDLEEVAGGGCYTGGTVVAKDDLN